MSQPPVVLSARDLAQRDGLTEGDVENVLTTQFQRYRATLQDDRRRLLECFRIVDIARKSSGSAVSALRRSLPCCRV